MQATTEKINSVPAKTSTRIYVLNLLCQSETVSLKNEPVGGCSPNAYAA